MLKLNLILMRFVFFQRHTVSTTVIPVEPEAGTPWWVWLVAGIAGILLLAAISYCLYKVVPQLSQLIEGLALIDNIDAETI